MQIAVQTDNSSLSANENLHFFQNIEGYNTTRLGWGTPGAKPVTLSFWVRSNVPGIYCVGLENNAVNKTCIREYEVNPGFKWQKVVLTFPGPTDGTWEVTNSVGIRVRFCLASGSAYDDGIDGQWVSSDELTTGNQVNFVSSTSNRYFITGVQLEAGKIATDFEHRSYGEELALCQRYCYQITGGSNTFPICNGSIWDATTFIGVANLPVPLRDPNNIDLESSAASHVVILSGGATDDATALSQVTHHSGSQVEFHASVTMTVGNGAWARLKSGTTFIRFVSEL